MRRFDKVTECHMTASGRDYIAKIHAADLADYERIIKGWRRGAFSFHEIAACAEQGSVRARAYVGGVRHQMVPNA